MYKIQIFGVREFTNKWERYQWRDYEIKIIIKILKENNSFFLNSVLQNPIAFWNPSNIKNKIYNPFLGSPFYYAVKQINKSQSKSNLSKKS